MRCPHCGYLKSNRAIDSSKVADTRPRYHTDNTIKRQRKCKGCGKRFGTVERIAIDEVS